MRTPTANAAEFREAVAALTNAGFTNARALELLTKRDELRDSFARAAITGFLANPSCRDAKDYIAAVEGGFTVADLCLVERMK